MLIVMLKYLILLLCTVCLVCQAQNEQEDDLFRIEGRVFPFETDQNWQSETKILVNGGEYLGFLKGDGSFAVSSVPSGSYVLEVVNPNFYYEPVRVEINTKGKFRARKVNYVQISQVIQVPYPLKLKAMSKFRYFQQREQWRVTDFLFSPMVLMMVLPLFLIMILPKMMNDPETKKEMEQLNNLTKYEMPEMSEVFTSLFSGGEKPKLKEKSSKSKKRQ